MMKQSVTETLNTLQSMLQPTSEIRETMWKNADGFWSNQDKILGSMEEFANSCVGRRRVGTKAALTAARRMCDAKTPVEMMQEYQAWAMGSLERVVADNLALQKHLMTVAGLLAKPLNPSEKEGVQKTMAIRTLAASGLTRRPDKRPSKK